MRCMVRFCQRTGVEVTLDHQSHAFKSVANTVKERFGCKGDEANVQIRAANHGARHDRGGACRRERTPSSVLLNTIDVERAGQGWAVGIRGTYRRSEVCMRETPLRSQEETVSATLRVVCHQFDSSRHSLVWNTLKEANVVLDLLYSHDVWATQHLEMHSWVREEARPYVPLHDLPHKRDSRHCVR